ncbi:MAG: YdeI/OmpD-associated family protein [Micropepsaceae bacterium]
MAKLSDSPVMPFKTKAAFATWVAKQPAASPGVWLKIAKKPETRAARIAKFVAMCAAGERIHAAKARP